MLRSQVAGVAAFEKAATVAGLPTLPALSTVQSSGGGSGGLCKSHCHSSAACASSGAAAVGLQVACLQKPFKGEFIIK